jgi:hypothetical protein
MTTFILRAVLDDTKDPQQHRTVNYHYHLIDPNNMAEHLDRFRSFLHAAGVPESDAARLVLVTPDDGK